MAKLEIDLDEEMLTRAQRLAAARQISVEDLFTEILAQLEARDTAPSIIGSMAEDAELLDEIVEEAMRDREARWRTSDLP